MRNLLNSCLIYFAILSQLSNLPWVECKKKNCKDKTYSRQNVEECGKKKKGGLLARAKFEEWSKWGQQFPKCDPSKNPNLSPVNILTKSAILVKNEIPLIIYSGPPQIATYFYSTEFIQDGTLIQAVNIHTRKENFREVTYIAGVGNTDYRYFQSAMFLFTVSPVEPQRSLHQIDGKKFMLEIVLTFADIPRSGELPSDITQIHVMVEKSDSIHPGWKFLEEGILGVTSLSDIPIDSTEQVQNAREDFDDATKTLARLKKAERKELKSDTYSDLAQDLTRLHKLVEGAEKVEGLKAEEKRLKESIQNVTAQVETLRKNKNAVQSSMDAIKEEITREIAAGIMLVDDQNDKTDKIEELRNELAHHEKNLAKVVTNLHLKTERMWDVSENLNKKSELLKHYHIGDFEGSKFKSVEELMEKLKLMKEKADDISTAEDELVAKKDILETIQSQSARDVLIANTPFQISWLLPSTGGYYRYNGSSVVPPCSPRTRVIVMENPIPMSDEQFTAISNYTLRGRFQVEFENDVPPQSMDNTIPIFHDLGNRQVFYNHKSLQFKLDDALHMQSKLRRQIKDSMRKSGSCDSETWDLMVVIFWSILLNFLH